MLYEDTLTGALYEAPESQVAGWGYAEDPSAMGEVVYDGLGNPVGFSFRRAFRGLVRRAMPFATSMLGPYGQIINRALPVMRQALQPMALRTAQALRQQALQQLSGFGEEAAAAAAPAAPMPAAAPPPAVNPGAPPMPAGWVQPPVPFTGPTGRRVYLRCSAWPGPRGLVPAAAASATVPGVAPAIVPGMPTTIVRRPGVRYVRRPWVRSTWRRR
ncbi:MAG TPA: hypothetical protein VJM50_23565 [Pyrinomonadaceae bacterium]|nr:hypothetical protein [Pyrinomonadaceae bacterium]